MAAAMAAEPFSYTATGVLGEKRETMLENPLHLRVSNRSKSKKLKLKQVTDVSDDDHTYMLTVLIR